MDTLRNFIDQALSIGFMLLLLLGPLLVLVMSFFLLRPNKQPASALPEAAGSQDGPWAQRFTPARLATVGLLIVVALGALYYRFLTHQQLEQSAALFVGLPTLLATLITFSPHRGSTLMLVYRVITIALLMSFVVSWEGYLCILMTAPLFYLVGFVVAKWIGHTRNKALRCSTALVLMLLSLEGVSPHLSLPVHTQVTVTRDLPVAADVIRQRLLGAPNFSRPLPPVLALGFPTPLGSEWAGTDMIIHWSGAEGRPPGDLRLAVTVQGENQLRFQAVSDTSHMSHWLQWETAEVSWQALSATHTRVTWTTAFQRRLHPGWYFGPLEAYVVREATAYLVATLER